MSSDLVSAQSVTEGGRAGSSLQTPAAQPSRTSMSSGLVFGNAKNDKALAREAMAEAIATSTRRKTAATPAAESTVNTSKLDFLTKAIAVIEGGMAGSFVQTPAAQSVTEGDMAGSSLQTPIAHPPRTFASFDLVFANAKNDRASANEAMAEAISMREKTAAAYAAENIVTTSSNFDIYR